MRTRTTPLSESRGGPDTTIRGVFLRRELTGGLLVAARAAVAAYGVLAIVVYVQWLPGWLQHQARDGVPATVAAGLTTLAAAAWIALALLVFARRSRDLLGLVLVAGFVSFGIVMGTFVETGAVVNAGRVHPWAPPWPATVILVANAFSLPWAYCFPDGRFVPRWSLVLAAVWMLITLVPAFGGPLPDQTPLGMVGTAVLTVGLVASTGATLVYRYVRRSTAVQRQQMKWVLLGGLVFVVVYLFVVPTGALLLPGAPSSQARLFQTIHAAIFALAITGIPVALAIAIFRQGLLDIDVILNRTLTYGALTVALALGFVAISGVANLILTAVTGRPSELVLLASVVPVALAFMPARARALRLANRFVTEARVKTLLFVDLVSSTERAYALGNRPWRELLERFRSMVRRCLKRHGGKEIDTTGDGFFATFDSPAQAVRCGHDIIGSVKPLGLEVRVGVHIGEVQMDGRYVEGGNVHLAARVMAAAQPGEVMVTGTLRDVLAGSEVHFDGRGAHQLKGVPGEVQLYAATA